MGLGIVSQRAKKSSCLSLRRGSKYELLALHLPREEPPKLLQTQDDLSRDIQATVFWKLAPGALWEGQRETGREGIGKCCSRGPMSLGQKFGDLRTSA